MPKKNPFFKTAGLRIGERGEPFEGWVTTDITFNRKNRYLGKICKKGFFGGKIYINSFFGSISNLFLSSPLLGDLNVRRERERQKIPVIN